ncbi:uncharacterized protein OCT59_028065 [Rhizophagus irregularis]|uniref:Uncharacterized protein n=1 Tax=Rhizophagus irregularis TaxID=588596 RepID=A0A915ZUP0_9GLOM|nr:hypothetical protein OCT59_028065 [Rhizophagus irregularis]GET65288.1 hypothetical protein RIR_jg5110.t2 [Rhizophagus irregularis DAOM 181602=DAOM 197198]CAB5332759.1 unnamed protein product [Rhizophagus irregularis]CAB5388016.1 unnamed protein product [Rhizophagus irregularis]
MNICTTKGKFNKLRKKNLLFLLYDLCLLIAFSSILLRAFDRFQGGRGKRSISLFYISVDPFIKIYNSHVV